MWMLDNFDTGCWMPDFSDTVFLMPEALNG